ncbi:MAG: hypothetical protein F6K09_19135 [Merismopedia sp. SIO2A8]|nr:hypothetical protein [Merismopedia sp. SIO2A8]
MATTAVLSNATDVTADHYLVVGLAHCFIKDEGEVHQVTVLEPIPSAALEALLKGIPTSYSLAYGTRIGDLLSGDNLNRPEVFPTDSQYCDDFAERAIAAARTYHARPAAQVHIPLHTTYQDFNLSLERKRVLNSERIVKAEDNVKQHAYTHQVL